MNTSSGEKSQREPGVGLALFLLSFVVLPVALESALLTLLRLASKEEVDGALRMRKEEREAGKGRLDCCCRVETAVGSAAMLLGR